MEKNDGLVGSLLVPERLTGIEKRLRDIYRLADELFLLIDFRKYPLTSGVVQYEVKIYGKYQKKWVMLIKEESMELDEILKEVKKKLIAHRDNTKDYMVQKAFGGELL